MRALALAITMLLVASCEDDTGPGGGTDGPRDAAGSADMLDSSGDHPPPADAPPADAPRRPHDGPAPDFLRPEHPGGPCPLDPPAEGTSCQLPPLSGCAYRPVCETGTPINQNCSCNGNRWNCDQGGYCAPPAPDAGGGPQCNYMGTLYDDGAVFPAADGCNSCKCNPGNTPGQVGCSLKACPPDAGAGQ